MTHANDLRLKQLPYWALLIFLFCSPLPFGGRSPVTWAPILVSIFLLSISVVIFNWQQVTASKSMRSARPVLAVLSLIVLWMLFQTFAVSWDSHISAVAGLKTVAYLLLFVATLALVDSRQKLEWLVWVLVLSGVLQVAIRLVFEVPGTFVNRNHFAAYLEMTVGLAIGLMVARLEPGGQRGWRESTRIWVKTFLGPKIVIRVLILLLVVGLILSRSRMGNIAFFGSLFIAGIIGLVTLRRVNRSVTFFLVSILIIDIALIGAFFGFERLQQRFEQISISEDPRTYTSEQTLGIIQENWITGVGAGSFYTAYPRYRDQRVHGFVEHAHNDLLQFPAELGLPAAVLLSLTVVHSMFYAIKVQRRRNSQFMKAMGFGAFMGIVAMLIHASAEFNLQRVSNSVAFIVLLCIPYLAWSLDRSSRKSG